MVIFYDSAIHQKNRMFKEYLTTIKPNSWTENMVNKMKNQTEGMNS